MNTEEPEHKITSMKSRLPVAALVAATVPIIGFPSFGSANGMRLPKIRGGQQIRDVFMRITRTHSQMLSLGCKFVGRFSRRRFVHVRADLLESFEPIRKRLAASVRGKEGG